MLIPISINQEDLTSQFDISSKEIEDIIDYVVKEVTAAFAVEWSRNASMTLKSTKDRYVNSLKVIDEGRMEGAVVLDYTNPLVRMIEEGAGAFDMKEGFSKSSKKTMKKNDSGWYLTIPFSFGTPNTLASNFTTVMPSEVYDVVKNKSINPMTNRSAGLTKNEIPDQYKTPKVRADIPESELFKEYKHKSSIFQGLYKENNKTTDQNSYGSFRRVSDKSDAQSWIHPGMNAANLAEKSFENFENNKMQVVVEDATNNALSMFGFE